MQQTLIIQLLQTFTLEEIKKLDKFLHSEYFHAHEDAMKLFDVIKAYYPDFISDQLAKEQIFAQLFPNRPFDDGVLRTLRKYLLRSVLNFLTFHRLEKEEAMSQLFLLYELIDRGVPTIFNKQVRQMENILENTTYHDNEYLLIKFLFKRLILEYQFMSNKREKTPTLDSAHDYLDQYYLASKLELICSALNNQLIIGKQIHSSFFTTEIFQYLEKDIQEFPLLIQVYYYAAQFLKNPENGVGAYQSFKQLMDTRDKSLSQKDLTQLYLYAIGYTNFLYRSGKKEYLKEMFEIYKQMLKYDLLFEGKLIPVHNYKNIVTLGLRLGDYEWTESFIDDYKQFIPEDFREGVYKYNLAHLYFYKEKYGDALKLMQDIDFLDTFYQLGYKLLQLKIFYQLEDVDSFFNLAKTFQTHIQRQKDIPEARLLAFQNFVKLLRNIFRIKIREKGNYEELKTKLMGIHPIIEKEWLVKKLEELSEIHSN